VFSIQEIDGKEVLRGGFNEIDGIGNAATEQISKTRWMFRSNHSTNS
jgi:hypothetical protein